jgi:hypothetical protein
MTTTIYEHARPTQFINRAEHVNGGATSRPTILRSTLWLGRAMSGLVVAFLLLASALPKMLLPEIAEQSMRELGFPERHLLLLACIELGGALLYAFPRTATLGAVMLTALLGGAVASQLRIDAPTFSHTLFPVYVGVFMWGGLWLRAGSARALGRRITYSSANPNV